VYGVLDEAGVGDGGGEEVGEVGGAAEDARANGGRDVLEGHRVSLWG
jgi:hypothetical protein